MTGKSWGGYRQKIVPLINAGALSVTEIAAEVGCNTSLVSYYERVTGKKAKRYKRGTRLSEEAVTKLMSLKGAPAKKVAEAMGIGLTTVYVYWGDYRGEKTEGGKRRRKEGLQSK